MSESIFVPTGDGYDRLHHAPLALEDDLQQLLNAHPQLLAIEEGTDGEPLRLLLVKHETPVPDRSSASARWSLDHLFIDTELVPTLVESKRARNPQVRREVVGQLLEYAAQAWVSWTGEDILEWLEASHPDRSADEVLTEFMGTPQDAGEVARTVERNLRAGRLRLVFVTDGVPDELQAIVEFLNANTLPDLEVLAVELRMYGDRGVIVPRVIGNTATAKAAKRRPSSISYEELLAQSSERGRQLDAELRRRWQQTGRHVAAKGKTLRLLSRDGVNVLYFHPDGTEAWFNEGGNHPRELVERYKPVIEELTGKRPKPDAKMLWLPERTLLTDLDAVMDLVLRYAEDLEGSRSDGGPSAVEEGTRG